MIGDTWASEISTLTDGKTGRTYQRLTTTGNNVHLYFTENSFDANKNEIIYRSDRATGLDLRPMDLPIYNIYRMDLATGVSTQLTDEPESVGSVTKTPDSAIVVYATGNKIKKLDMVTGATTVLYEETGNYRVGASSIACNRRYVAFIRNEKVAVERGPNYAGFADRFYKVKDARITLAYLDGSGSFDVIKDTHQVGHFQFCPDDPTLATYCHEGPWNLVTQRIWFLDFCSGEARPCYRQEEYDSIGHEFWTQDGYVFFDDRGPGHDGTITSTGGQAVATDVHINENEMTPFVGLMDRDGNLVRRIDMPFYCNHYHANPDNTMLVGDDVNSLVLIDISGETASLETLLHHNTSWHTGDSHCHPTWSWDGSQILFVSDEGGHNNLYMTTL